MSSQSYLSTSHLLLLVLLRNLTLILILIFFLPGGSFHLVKLYSKYNHCTFFTLYLILSSISAGSVLLIFDNMSDLRPRLSTSCVYDMKPAQPQRFEDTEWQSSTVSPISRTETPASDEKCVVFPPAEKATYFPDDKICMPATGDIEMRKAVLDPTPPVPLPNYTEAELPARPQRRPLVRRHIWWFIAGAVIFFVFIGIILGSALKPSTNSGRSVMKTPVTNNTANSVASTGLFLTDGTTWNMHFFAQDTMGNINLRISLNGGQFESVQNVTLIIPPRVGSPMTATAEQGRSIGVVMINLFYLSGQSNITMCTIACAANRCNTISNLVLPTEVPASNYTGLSAVNVNNAQDWRVYYHDNQGSICELQGNVTAFDGGKRIGGTGLNSTSIAAVNINSTTNNIHIFYVDNVSRNLYTMQFNGAWTTPLPVVSSSFSAWNPLSGLGAAYFAGLDQLHVYFTGLDSRVYETVGGDASGLNAQWSSQPTSQRVWAGADYAGADITALGWNDQVRFFQISQGKVVQGKLNNQTWTESFIA